MATTLDTSILTPQTDAANSSEFQVINRPVTVSIYTSDGGSMTAAEYSDLQRYTAAGQWVDVYDSNGQVRMSSTRTELTVVAGGSYRIAKEATTQSVGVAVAIAPLGV